MSIALKPAIPALTREHCIVASSGISRQPGAPKKKRKGPFDHACEVGFLHIDIAEVRAVREKYYLIIRGPTGRPSGWLER